MENLHGFFDRAVAQWPDRLAVDVPAGMARSERIAVTYSELAEQANVLAQSLGPWVDRECVVGICLPRDSSLLYAAQLAVLRSGAAYTCLDPSFPDERLRVVLQDAGVVAVMTNPAGAGRVSAAVSNSVGIIDAQAVLDGQRVEASPSMEPHWLTPESLAYVIYTSGTTGQPKGVLIEHQSIANLVKGDLVEFGLGPGDRVAQGSSAAYDSSVEETWLAFAAGATLVVMDEEVVRMGPDLIAWMRSERISVFCPPPTLLRATGCEDPRAELPDLRLLYVGGEALPEDVAELWSQGRRLVNGYGPTECSVTALRADVEAGKPITIGKAIPGMTAFVLDDDLREVPEGQRGELCLGGLGLARGYHGDDGLTGERFISHPRLGRIYRTGDWVHRDGDGNHHFHGRIDGQVKLRGYRIELGGIEAHLMGCAGVSEVACCVQGTGAQSMLVAFVVPQDPQSPPTVEALQKDLGGSLPSHMVPARIHWIDKLPTTVGGKLDRGALPKVEAREHGANGPLAAPRDDMETLLEAGFRECLGLGHPVSIHADFFRDLGGDSLGAALLVSAARRDPRLDWIAVRDLYEAPTVAGLACKAPVGGHGSGANHPRGRKPHRGSSAGGLDDPRGSLGHRFGFRFVVGLCGGVHLVARLDLRARGGEHDPARTPRGTAVDGNLHAFGGWLRGLRQAFAYRNL